MEMNNEAIRYIEALREQYVPCCSVNLLLMLSILCHPVYLTLYPLGIARSRITAPASNLKCNKKLLLQPSGFENARKNILSSCRRFKIYLLRIWNQQMTCIAGQWTICAVGTGLAISCRAFAPCHPCCSEQMAALETTSRGLHAEQQRQQKVHTDVQQVAASNNSIGEPDRHISSPHQLLPSAPSPGSTVQVHCSFCLRSACHVALSSFLSQLRLGDVKKRLDSKLSELMNVQVPSSAKVVADQQVCPA